MRFAACLDVSAAEKDKSSLALTLRTSDTEVESEFDGTLSIQVKIAELYKIKRSKSHDINSIISVSWIVQSTAFDPGLTGSAKRRMKG